MANRLRGPNGRRLSCWFGSALLVCAGCGGGARHGAAASAANDASARGAHTGPIRVPDVTVAGRDASTPRDAGGTRGGRDAEAGTATEAGTAIVDSATARDADTGSNDAGHRIDAGLAAISGHVLTDRPGLGFVDEGTNDVTIVSASFRFVAPTSTGATLMASGELKNQGSVTRCLPLFSVASIGSVQLTALAKAPPYTGVGDLTEACLAPGGRGAWTAIKNDVATDLLEQGVAFHYAITAVQATTQMPDADAPVLLTQARVATTIGVEIDGQFRSGSIAIYNLEIDFFAKDERGLIVDDSSAFPAMLGTIAPNAAYDYKSSPFLYSGGEPAAVIAFSEFIHGTAPSATGEREAVPSEIEQRMARVERARAEFSAQQRLARRDLGGAT